MATAGIRSPLRQRLAQTARTVPLEGLDDLAPMLDHLWEHVEAVPAATADDIDVAFTTGEPGPADAGVPRPSAHLEALDRMAALGVTWSSTAVPGDSVAAAVEAIERYGAEVISPSRA